MRTCAAAAVLLALSGTAALAQENIYVGLGYGGFDYQEKATDVILDEVGDTLASYKLFGGFEFTENFAVEISYGETEDLKDAGARTVTISDGVNVIPDVLASRDLRIDFTTTALKALGIVPLEWGVFFGGAGWFQTKGDVRQVTTLEHSSLPEPVVFNDAFELTNDGLMATLGVEWRFGRFGTRYGIRLEYEWWDIDEVNASTIGLGISYGF